MKNVTYTPEELKRKREEGIDWELGYVYTENATVLKLTCCSASVYTTYAKGRGSPVGIGTPPSREATAERHSDADVSSQCRPALREAGGIKRGLLGAGIKGSQKAEGKVSLLPPPTPVQIISHYFPFSNHVIRN